jgi:uncharacterized membrane protein YccC
MSEIAGRRAIEAVEHARLSRWDIAYAAAMAIASLIAYWAMSFGLMRIVDRDSDFLGGMWAAVAAIFVFRDTREGALAAGLARLIATSVSFALCLPYFLLFPFNPIGMAAVLALGAAVMMLLGRREDIITTGITTVVVMIVAGISPKDAWEQPLLRLVDTIVGIAVGVSFRWLVYLGLGAKRPQ